MAAVRRDPGFTAYRAYKGGGFPLDKMWGSTLVSVFRYAARNGDMDTIHACRREKARREAASAPAR